MEEFRFVNQINPKVDLRIGAVPYLNGKPLIFGMEGDVKLATPTRLVELFQHRHLDVVLAPLVEYFRNDRMALLPEIGIVSRGSVESVKLFYKNNLRTVRRVAVDSSSRTSELLLRLILEKKYAIHPEYVRTSVSIDFETSVYDAMLVIGDATFRVAKKYRYLDLGKCWDELTGTPFVYACWMIDRNVDAQKVFRKLLQARDQGIKNLDRIARTTDVLPTDQVLKYLTQNIRYELGLEEVKGIRLFQHLLKEAGLLESERELLFAKVG